MSAQPSPDQRVTGGVRAESRHEARTRTATGEHPTPPRLVPRFIHAVGAAHRTFYRLTRGRLGLSRPKPDRWGTMCLRTVGRRTGKQRSAILGYYEDGVDLVAIAVNGWADTEPAWWRNLQDDPDAVVELPEGPRSVRARAAQGEERARLWARWRDLGQRSGNSLMTDIDGYAARLSREVAVVVLEPRSADEATSLRNGRIEMESSRDHRGPMHIEESGTPGSPAILFLHGLGQSSREWRGHTASLSGFHCLAPDLPGHGRSSHLSLPSTDQLVDDLAALIETRVPAGRAHVVGISWGAFLVQVLMQRHPDRVERAVSDGTPLVWPRGSRPLMLSFVSLVAPFLHTRPVLALYRDIVDAADLRVASRRTYWKVWALRLRHLVAATEAPCSTLLVAGEKEGYVRPGDAALAALMPHAEAWYAPGLGHCWQRVVPDLHIRMLEAWFSGLELPSELRRELPPSPDMVTRVRSMGPGNWYVRHKSRIMREVRFSLRHYRKHFEKAYGKAEGQAIARESMQRFEVLLADLPYIGGDENRNTRSLYMTAAWLAMYQSLQARGASVEEAARLIYLGAASFFESFPARWLMRWQGRSLLGRKRIEQSKRRAAISQERRYPDDWVFEVVEGDGHDFIIGTDYTECGVVKYLAREGAPELAPYLCWIDYPLHAAARLRLDRTETLAQGGRRCDFRMSRGKPAQVEPEFLHV